MTDPNAANELLKQVMDAYRVFSIELQALQLKKSELIKAIITRVDREKTDDVQKVIKQMIYERSSPQA
jgi:hypothetical protein